MYKLSIKKIFYVCVAIEVLIFLADLTLNHWNWIPFRPLRRSFNITREDSIVNWFSSLQAVAVALSLWFVAVNTKEKRDAFSWKIISAFFLFIAIDDATKFHERVGSSFKIWMQESGMNSASYPSYTWQISIGPFFVIFGLYMLYFFWTRIKDKKIILWLLSAFSCYGIAVIMDYVEGARDFGYPIPHFLKAVEEVIEMLGTTAFLCAFLAHLMGIKKKHEIELAI